MKLPYLTRSAAVKSESMTAELFRQRAPTVIRFCELFLGDPHVAEEATIRAFTCSLGEQAAAPERTPVRLLTCAFRESLSLSARVPNPSHPLKAAILRLDEVERAVFILHTTLSVQIPWVAAIVGISHDEAIHAWTKALIEIRTYLPKDFFKERSR